MPSIGFQSPDHSLFQPMSKSNPVSNRVSDPSWAQSKPNQVQFKPIHSNPTQPCPVQCSFQSILHLGAAHSIPDSFQPSPIHSNPKRSNPSESSQVNSIAAPNPVGSRSYEAGPAPRSPHHSCTARVQDQFISVNASVPLAGADINCKRNLFVTYSARELVAMQLILSF